MNNQFPVPTLRRVKNELMLESVLLSDIAERFGTPVYVYSLAALRDAYKNYQNAFTGRNTLIFYALKANSNLGILSVFAKLGAGFDIVSGGELARVLAAGGEAAKVVFSGVGKTVAEIQQAIKANIRCFNVESADELDRINLIAGSLGRVAPVALRVNPDVNPKTHPYISTGLKNNKFGVAFDEALTLYRHAAAQPHLHVSGIACHIGSQLLDSAPIAEAADKLIELIERLNSEGIVLQHIDLGGGLGIRYCDETVPSIADYFKPLLQRLEGRPEQLCVEPGRSLVGNAGVLLTRIEYLKTGSSKNFAIVDAAMNDLMRPALYDARHAIVAVRTADLAPQHYEVVGPICESSDFLAKDCRLAVEAGDLLAILSAGAYGMTMSSNYNSRPRAAEVIVDGKNIHLVRARETVESLYALEKTLKTSD